jgi:hypothetical protein
MIRARTLWPHHVGGLTFRYASGGHFRVNAARTHWRGEGFRAGKRAEDWPASPARHRHITWWRMHLAQRRETDRACRAVARPVAEGK